MSNYFLLAWVYAGVRELQFAFSSVHVLWTNLKCALFLRLQTTDWVRRDVTSALWPQSVLDIASRCVWPQAPGFYSTLGLPPTHTHVCSGRVADVPTRHVHLLASVHLTPIKAQFRRVKSATSCGICPQRHQYTTRKLSLHLQRLLKEIHFILCLNQATDEQ